MVHKVEYKKDLAEGSLYDLSDIYGDGTLLATAIKVGTFCTFRVVMDKGDPENVGGIMNLTWDMLKGRIKYADPLQEALYG